jgi:hypothetical protein
MNAIDVLTYGDGEVRAAVAAFPPTEWETPGAAGEWRARDVIGHLAAFELLLAEVLAELRGHEGPTPLLDEYRELGPEAFNDEEAAKRARTPAAALVAEYEQANAHVMELARLLPPEGFVLRGTLPWYGAEYSLDDFIAYGYYGHKREHCAQLASFVDALARQRSEPVAAR